jgi:hypothetical protein
MMTSKGVVGRGVVQKFPMRGARPVRRCRAEACSAFTSDAVQRTLEP